MSKRTNTKAQAPAQAPEIPATDAATVVTTDSTEAASEEPAEPVTATEVDPFADVPVTKLEDNVSFDDFSDMPTAQARKYANVHAAAVADRMPTLKGWKHERVMLIPGSNRQERKPNSVYGVIQQVVNAAGRAGIPAYVVATKVRKLAAGNKRSHYCVEGDAGALPPVGWAEGWINTAIQKSIVSAHPTKQAPDLKSTVTEGEQRANEAEAQGRIAA